MPGPTAPPRRRLGGLNNPSIGPKLIKKKLAPPRPVIEEPKCCSDPKIEDEDGHKVCKNCFTEIAENNIVADVTFEEDSRGAHTVQGGFISDNARHAKTLGAAARRLGGDQRNSTQEIEANGRRALNALCPRLGIPDSVASQAVQLFIFASQHRFSSGRKTEEVAAACLYAACRRQKENTVMLIDIAELIQVNVFRLGEVYKDMCTKLYLEEASGVGASGVGRQYLVEVEYLVMKYCRKLEFGDATRQVAEDAVKILKRMKRDWMVTGRHPAGLCGACIILAARMNNFRRTTREIVLVAKVADQTLAKRVEEFRRTKSAALTVEQFREYGVRLKHQADPPIIYESQLRKEKFEQKKRKRQVEAAERDRQASEASSRAASVVSLTSEDDDQEVAEDEERRKRSKTISTLPSPPATQTSNVHSQPTSSIDPALAEAASTSSTESAQPRKDADGFAIPALPSQRTAGPKNAEASTTKRGRKKKEALAPIIITDEELATEEELRKEIVDVLDDELIIESSDEVQQAREAQRAQELAGQQKELAAAQAKARREASGTMWWTSSSNGSSDIVTNEDLEREFENDPEVMNCLLTPAEQKVKEHIWVTFNEDWLRVQHEKQLLAEVAKAHPPTTSKRGAKGGKRKKKGRLGDGTTLAEATTPIESPADASQAMLEKRANATFYKNLDYSVLSRIYGNRSRSSSRVGSETPEPTGQQQAASSTGSDEEEEEEEEETDAKDGNTSQKLEQAVSTETPHQGGNDESHGGSGGDGDGGGDDEDDVNYDYDEDDNAPRSWLDTGDDDREDIGEDDDGYSRAIDLASRETENFGHEFEDEY